MCIITENLKNKEDIMVDTNTKQFSCFKEWLHAYLVPHLVIYIPFLKDADGNNIIGEDGRPKKDSEHIKGIDTGWNKMVL